MTRDERTYKLKLLAREPTEEMLHAADFCEPPESEDAPYSWQREYYKAHFAAAPNDATERLAKLLRGVRSYIARESPLAPMGVISDIDALLKELCDD